MAHKRKRGNGWEYIVKRADVLPKPLYFTFDDEAEGDEYVRRVEALLDHGIVPVEFNDKKEVRQTVRECVRRYLDSQHVSADELKLLHVVVARLPAELALPDLTFVWATHWVTSLKRDLNLKPTHAHLVKRTPADFPT